MINGIFLRMMKNSHRIPDEQYDPHAPIYLNTKNNSRFDFPNGMKYKMTRFVDSYMDMVTHLRGTYRGNTNFIKYIKRGW